MEIYRGLNQERLEAILSRIRQVRTAIIGDMCLDVYWRADMTRSVLSRETPHFPLPVVEEWMSPGGGGNVAANLAALQPMSVRALGVIGRDWRGDILSRKLAEAGINISGLAVSMKTVTNAYCKPLRKGLSVVEYEDPRIDFSNYEDLPQADETELLLRLDQCAQDIDILCVADQLTFGCVTPAVREKIMAYARQGLPVVVDSRDRISCYRGVIMKPNEIEGYRAVNQDYRPGGVTLEEAARVAARLAGQNQSQVCLTLGARGCLYADTRQTIHIPSCPVAPPIDICGAGDTFLAAFSCAVAAGALPREAASLANFAADVTIRKIGMTGTASPAEILARHRQIQAECRT